MEYEYYMIAVVTAVIILAMYWESLPPRRR